MKIVLSGSAGIGKTTLAEAISKSHGYEYIAEHYDLLFENADTFNSPKHVLIELFNTVLSKKLTVERKHSHIISDRSPVDLFNLWMSKGLWKNDEETRKFHKRCCHYSSHYDYVVLLPWGAIPLEQNHNSPSGQKRIMNRWVQFHNHSNIIGLTRQWVKPDRIIQIPDDIIDIEERENYVVRKAKITSLERV